MAVSLGQSDQQSTESTANTAHILVDQTGHTLDPPATSETTNGRLGDTLNVVTSLLGPLKSASNTSQEE